MRELADLITEYVNMHQAEYVAWLANKRRNEDGKKAEKKSTASGCTGAGYVYRNPDRTEHCGLAD